MEQTRQKLIATFAFLCFCLMALAADTKESKVSQEQDVLTSEPNKPTAKMRPELDGAQQENVVVISEKTLYELEHQKLNPTKVAEIKEDPKPTPAANSQVHVEESIFKSKPYSNMDLEIPNSFKTGFYFFLALSTSAIILIVVKVYRLRLSRAERKYGVQGDRTTQELTPLPISIEDGNSDEEDQTLFEINRHDIRIF